MWSKNTSFLILIVIGLAIPNLKAELSVNGKVTDQNGNPVKGASVTIAPEKNSNLFLVQRTKSNGQGEFAMIFNQTPGTYLLDATAPGFQDVAREKIYLDSGYNTLDIVMNPINLYSITVAPDRDSLRLEESDLSQTLTRRDIINIPGNRSTNIQAAIASMFPGAIMGPDNKLHFNGDPANLNNFQLGCCIITDPVTYFLEASLIPPEALNSLDLLYGQYRVDGGRGFTTLVINPETGRDVDIDSGKNKFGYGAVNFIPGFEYLTGIQITDFKPRLYGYGPVIKNRLWFHQSLQANYDRNVFPELTEGKNYTSSWAGNSLTNLHAQITPKHFVNFNFMANYRHTPDHSLSPVHPPETTSKRTEEIYTWNISNQFYFSPETSVELGYGYYRSSFGETPKGEGILEVTPLGQRGFYPFNARREGRRHQFFSNISHSPRFLPGHRIKTGFDLHRTGFCQDIKRTGIEHYRFDNTLSSRRIFHGNGKFCASNFEKAFYIQDGWNILPDNKLLWLPRMYAQMGARFDGDEIIGTPNITSRYSLTLMPRQLRGTKISAGFGFIPSPYPLSLLSRHNDQYTISANFDRHGEMRSEPFVTALGAKMSELGVPRATNFSIAVEQELPGRTKFRTNFIRKRSRDFPTFIRTGEKLDASYFGQPLPDLKGAALYKLTGAQKVWYDALEFSAQKRGRHDWFLSYTFSKDKSNAALNAFIEDPIVFSDTAGPMPWSSPHRLMAYGFFEIDKKNAIAYHVQYRTGFPYTSHDDNGEQVGGFNSRRMPDYFSLNLHYERKFERWKILGYKLALRVGCDNCTNNPNYSFINASTADPLYPRFVGKDPRKPIVLRIRTWK